MIEETRNAIEPGKDPVNAIVDELEDATTDEIIRMLIGNLPEKLRPLAEVFTPVMVRMSEREVNEWVDWAMLGGDKGKVKAWNRIYHPMARQMTNEELLVVGEKMSEYLVKNNLISMTEVGRQCAAVTDVVKVVVGLLQASLK